MDRRSFILSLVGGMAAASVGGIAMAQAAQTRPTAEPLQAEPAAASVDAKALDETDAEFSQYYRRRRMMRRRRPMRRAYRSDRRSRPNSQR